MQILSSVFVCFDLYAFMVATLLVTPLSVYMVCSTLKFNNTMEVAYAKLALVH